MWNGKGGESENQSESWDESESEWVYVGFWHRVESRYRIEWRRRWTGLALDAEGAMPKKVKVKRLMPVWKQGLIHNIVLRSSCVWRSSTEKNHSHPPPNQTFFCTFPLQTIFKRPNLALLGVASKYIAKKLNPLAYSELAPSEGGLRMQKWGQRCSAKPWLQNPWPWKSEPPVHCNRRQLSISPQSLYPTTMILARNSNAVFAWDIFDSSACWAQISLGAFGLMYKGLKVPCRNSRHRIRVSTGLLDVLILNR